MMAAYIPVRLGISGYDPTWAGLIVTGLSAGGVAGALFTGLIVRRVGHARAFMIFCALIVLSNALIGAGVDPRVWIAARVLYGFAICGMFIVGQSWLNDAVSNDIRGRVMAVFYVSYIVGLGIGAWGMGLLDISAAAAPLVGIAFTALSILPVGLTRLPVPPPPKAHPLPFAAHGRSRPSGLAACWRSAGYQALSPASRPSMQRHQAMPRGRSPC